MVSENVGLSIILQLIRLAQRQINFPVIHNIKLKCCWVINGNGLNPVWRAFEMHNAFSTRTSKKRVRTNTMLSAVFESPVYLQTKYKVIYQFVLLSSKLKTDTSLSIQPKISYFNCLVCNLCVKNISTVGHVTYFFT